MGGAVGIGVASLAEGETRATVEGGEGVAGATRPKRGAQPCMAADTAATTRMTRASLRSTHILGALSMPASTSAPPAPAALTAGAAFRARRDRAAAAARDAGIGALLVGPGSDLAYLCGHRIHTSERMTCLVIAAS